MGNHVPRFCDYTFEYASSNDKSATAKAETVTKLALQTDLSCMMVPSSIVNAWLAGSSGRACCRRAVKSPGPVQEQPEKRTKLYCGVVGFANRRQARMTAVTDPLGLKVQRSAGCCRSLEAATRWIHPPHGCPGRNSTRTKWSLSGPEMRNRTTLLRHSVVPYCMF